MDSSPTLIPCPKPILHLPKTNTLIRPLHNTPSEAHSLASHANNPKIAQYMRNAFPSPYTVQDSKSWITYTASQNPQYDFAIVDSETNTAIGGIGLKPRTDVQHRSLEIGYWLGEEFWGRGIGSEVVAGFSEWVFGAFPGVVRLEAEVFEGNQGSMRVLERAGFVLEGRKRKAVEKDGVLLDTFVYGLVREGV